MHMRVCNHCVPIQFRCSASLWNCALLANAGKEGRRGSVATCVRMHVRIHYVCVGKLTLACTLCVHVMCFSSLTYIHTFIHTNTHTHMHAYTYRQWTLLKQLLHVLCVCLYVCVCVYIHRLDLQLIFLISSLSWSISSWRLWYAWICMFDMYVCMYIRTCGMHEDVGIACMYHKWICKSPIRHGPLHYTCEIQVRIFVYMYVRTLHHQNLQIMRTRTRIRAYVDYPWSKPTLELVLNS
jgi:hypothetical protein